MSDDDPKPPGIWRAVHDKHTLDACELADGAAWHGPVPKDVQHHCRCTLSSVDDLPRHELIGVIAGQEAMLTHASATIGRLEGRWRAPGAAKAGSFSLVIQQGTLLRVPGICEEDGGLWWVNGSKVSILAWCELPPIPADESYAGLE